MQDLCEKIRKSMFVFFCKHHRNLVEERFEVPRRLKISKKSFKNLDFSRAVLKSGDDEGYEVIKEYKIYDSSERRSCRDGGEL